MQHYSFFSSFIFFLRIPPSSNFLPSKWQKNSETTHKMDESPADRTRLILTIQRQTETLDRLHAAIKEEKNTNQHLAQKIATLEVDNSKLSALKVENAEFRRELGHLQGLIADFQHRQEEVFTREALSLGKQNEMHQTEMRSLHDQISKSSHEAQLLRTTNAEKDARIAVLVDKLSSEGYVGGSKCFTRFLERFCVAMCRIARKQCVALCI